MVSTVTCLSVFNYFSWYCQLAIYAVWAATGKTQHCEIIVFVVFKLKFCISTSLWFYNPCFTVRLLNVVLTRCQINAIFISCRLFTTFVRLAVLLHCTLLFVAAASRSWALQKRLNRSWCCSDVDSGGPREPYIRWGSRSPHAKGQFWGRKGADPGHARTCPAVDILNVTQQGAEPIRCGCKFGYIRWGGGHWRNLANTTELSVCCGDAALCKITLTAC